MKLVGQEFVIMDDFGWPRNPDGYNKLVKRVAQKAGISDIHPHMFRHTFVSLLMSALVAGLTVGGKAIGKNIAVKSCTSIVHMVGKIIHMVSFRKAKKKK